MRKMLWVVHPEGKQLWQGDIVCLSGRYLAMPFSFVFLPKKKAAVPQGREEGICSTMNVYLLFTSEMPMSICAVWFELTIGLGEITDAALERNCPLLSKEVEEVCHSLPLITDRSCHCSATSRKREQFPFIPIFCLTFIGW